MIQGFEKSMLFFYYIEKVYFNDFYISRCNGHYYVDVEMVSLLYMNNFYAENNTILGQMVFFLGIDFIEMSNFYCTNCYSPSTFEQIIYFGSLSSPYSSDNKTVVFNLDSFFCNFCSQSITNIIYIDTYGSNSLSFVMSNIIINNSLCGDSMIYFSKVVNLESGLIENITVSNSFSSGAIISDNHLIGKLRIVNFLSFFNTANNAGVSSSYNGLYNKLILEIVKLNITTSTSLISGCYFYSLLPGSYIILEDFAYESVSTALMLTNVFANITASTIKSGKGMQLTNSVLNGFELIFERIRGTVVTMSYGSVFNCNFCIMSDIINGPAINILDSTISVSNSVFKNISSSSPGMVLYMNFCNTKNKFFNCTFSECSSTGGGLMDISGSNLEITNCTIKENKST